MKIVVCLLAMQLFGVACGGGVYNIRDFGALGGDCLDTDAIQAAIDTAWKAGGGEVVVPEGFFRTGGIRLRSNITLHLLEGAVIEGSWNCADYDILERDRLEPVAREKIEDNRRSNKVTSNWNHALIRAYKANNVAIIGEKFSLIDGGNCYDAQGEEKYRGPHALSFWDCTGVKLRGYTIRNSSNWAHIVVRCPKATFDNITVYGGHDGLDIHCCEDTEIRNCRFFTGDDAIAGFGNIRTHVADCIFCCSCNDVRFGGDGALFERCKSIRPAPWGHRLQMSISDKAASRNHGEATRHNGNLFNYYCDSRWGEVPNGRNIVFKDCEFDGVNKPIIYDWGHQWGNFKPLEDLTFDNCRFTNVHQPLYVKSSKETPVTITFRNCSVSAAPDMMGKELVEGQDYKAINFDNTKIIGFAEAKK